MFRFRRMIFAFVVLAVLAALVTVFTPVLATWIIRSKLSPFEAEKNPHPLLANP